MLAAALRRDIAFGVLPPDQRLKIEALRRRYGGSSHSLREALTLLSTEGLVDATAQRGFRVASATEEDLRDIARLRAELEPLGLRWAIARDDLAWEGRVVAAAHMLVRAETAVAQDPDGEALAWDEASRHFHACLIEAGDSPRLNETAARLYDQSRRFRLAALRENRLDFHRRLDQRERLLAAIMAHDGEAAARRLARIILEEAGLDADIAPDTDD